jgi:hypothetical protein
MPIIDTKKPRNVFTRMLGREAYAEESPGRPAKKWLLKKARQAKYRRIGTSKFRNANEQQLIRNLGNPESLKSKIMIGGMYMFMYEPKTKDKLEFYDTFPLVIPIKDYSDGFLGINMHYLDPRNRALLMDGLYETLSDENYDEGTKLRLTYELLTGTSKYRYFRPCIKRYLTPHIRSRFIKIESEEWDNVLFLPTERFEKANRRKVWNNSKKEVITNAI